MAEQVVPTEDNLKGIAYDHVLIREAEESAAADHQLTIFQALKRYKKATFWAMILSTSLIMEGYDVVIITSFYGKSDAPSQHLTKSL